MRNLKTTFVVSILLTLTQVGIGQTYTGKVVDQNNENLIGASVYWLNTTHGTMTDIDGEFSIAKSTSTNQLVVSFVGFNSDTLRVTSTKKLIVVLHENISIGEVTINAEREGTYISKVDPIKTKNITQEELTKSACCDLAGCFGTDGSVQAASTNIITNSKELRIMGLSGVYSQVLIDGLPMIQGLTSTYGISSYPGTLVDNISIAIGANSVLQGFESINGQLNIQLQDPNKSEKFFLNGYINNFMEKQVNASVSKKGQKWSTVLAGHTTQPGIKIDRDEDTFIDVPQIEKYSLYNKWKRGNADSWGFNTMIGWRFVHEKRNGGQMDFDPTLDANVNQPYYGQTVEYSQVEAYTKTGYRFNDKKSLVFLASMTYHDQNSKFGTTLYDGEQVGIYSNLQYELQWGQKHLLKTGVSLRNNDVIEVVSFIDNPLERSFDGQYVKHEFTPGVFIENVFRWKQRTTLITGIRADNDSNFGAFVTPRAMLKFEATENSTLRISGGTGYRTVNLFSENVNLLASSREVIITEELKPEKAFNWGVNFINSQYWKNVTATFGFDFYRTQFSNQIFPDYNTDPTSAIVSNYEETSISNGLQLESNLTFYEVFNFKVSYNYLDVYQGQGDNKRILPFIPKHKFISSMSYKPKSKKWHADANVHWFGKQHLAQTIATDDVQAASQSQEYYLINAQFTKSWEKFEIYFGCENIFDYYQERPIQGWENPFGLAFDTSNVWGPTRGREYYLGFRFRLK